MINVRGILVLSLLASSYADQTAAGNDNDDIVR
jgi:hypothetical protein